MAMPTPPPQGISPPMAVPPVPPPQWLPDPRGVYRKVVGAPSPFEIMQQDPMSMGMGPPVSEESLSPSGFSEDAVTRRMQRNEDRARRQQEQPPSPVASQSY